MYRGCSLRRNRLDILPPITRHQRRNQAGIPLIGLFRFAQPPLSAPPELRILEARAQLQDCRQSALPAATGDGRCRRTRRRGAVVQTRRLPHVRQRPISTSTIQPTGVLWCIMKPLAAVARSGVPSGAGNASCRAPAMWVERDCPSRRGTSGRHPVSGYRRQFRRVLEEHPNRPIYMPEICAAIGVPERARRPVPRLSWPCMVSPEWEQPRIGEGWPSRLAGLVVGQSL